MFLKGLNDMKEWGSKTLPHNKRLFPKWEFETLAEDKGILWNPNLGLHRVGHFRGDLVNKACHEIEKSFMKRIKRAPYAHKVYNEQINHYPNLGDC